MSSQSARTEKPYPIVDLVNMILSEAIGLGVRRVTVMLLEDRIQVSYDGSDRDAPPRRIFASLFGCLWLYGCRAARLKLLGEFLCVSSDGGIGYEINIFTEQNRDLASELKTLTDHVGSTLEHL